MNAGNDTYLPPQKSEKSFMSIGLEKGIMKNIDSEKSDNYYIKSFSKTNFFSHSFSKYLEENNSDILSQIPRPNELKVSAITSCQELKFVGVSE